MTEKIEVDKEALKEVLTALNGPSYLIRELQVIRRLGDNPIDTLINNYNESIKE